MMYSFIASLFIITAKSQILSADCTSDDDCTDTSAPFCYADFTCASCLEVGNDTDCTDNPSYGPGSTCDELHNNFHFPYCTPPTCTSSSDCAGSTFYPVCNEMNGFCARCVNDTDCMDNPDFGEGYTCQDSGTDIGYFCTNETSTPLWPKCSTDSDCGGFNVCHNTTYQCVLCQYNEDCVNHAWFGNGTICADLSDLLGFAWCIGAPCDTSADCGSFYPICADNTNTCAQCNDVTDCDEGWYCDRDFHFGNRCVDNRTETTEIPITSTFIPSSTIFAPDLCMEEGKECDAGDEEGICTEFSIGGVTIKYCLPTYIKLCDDGNDCLTGQTCIDGFEGISFCAESDYDSVCSVDPNDCDDGLTCYDASNNANKDNFCYLSCTVETQDDDCDIDGYKCQLSEVNDVELLTCVYDASTVADPTQEPTAQPTIEPTEDEDKSGVEQLAIFGAMVIMMVSSLFM